MYIFNLLRYGVSKFRVRWGRNEGVHRLPPPPNTSALVVRGGNHPLLITSALHYLLQPPNLDTDQAIWSGQSVGGNGSPEPIGRRHLPIPLSAYQDSTLLTRTSSRQIDRRRLQIPLSVYQDSTLLTRTSSWQIALNVLNRILFWMI